MAKSFSVLSWNIKHFRNAPERMKAVVSYLEKWSPDVFGLYEVEGKEVFRMMAKHFPGYSFFITEGQQSQEIMVACKKSFNVIAFQQKREFDTGNPALRPGALLSFERYNELYGLLFLHTDSGTGAADFGNRAEMFTHAFNLKRTLDKKYGNAKLMILGDLNTMGLQYPAPKKVDTKVEGNLEIFNLSAEAEKVNMRVLKKEESATWKGSKGTSDLDNIITSTAIPIRTFGGGGNQYSVKVDGWIKIENKEKQRQFLKEVSDHCLLYCVVER